MWRKCFFMTKASWQLRQTLIISVNSRAMKNCSSPHRVILLKTTFEDCSCPRPHVNRKEFSMSRAYDISDFAAFLRKYGDSVRDRAARTEEPSRDGSHRTRPDRDRQQHRSQSSNGYDRSRTIYRGRNREYSLGESEVQTLADVGKFRMVPADDLARFAYGGDRSRMESDVQNLRRQGLVEQRSIEGHESYSKQVFTLTKEGHKLLSRQNLIPDRQAIYHGFVKAKEARHDADLYRLYHKVAKEIHRSG